MKNFLSFASVILCILHRGFHIKNKIHASSAIVNNVDDDEDSDRNDIDIDGRLLYYYIYLSTSNAIQEDAEKYTKILP